MILSKTTPRTLLEVWFPKYSTKHTTNEYVVLLAKYKVDSARPHLVIKFTKAKHLKGKQFYISKEKAQRYQVESNGSIPCYAVLFSGLQALDNDEVRKEIKRTALELFPN